LDDFVVEAKRDNNEAVLLDPVDQIRRALRMQERGENRSTNWRPCVPLSETEGY
jgi:hypothetical protein